MALKVQQLPHWPCYLMWVVPPLITQLTSIESLGKAAIGLVPEELKLVLLLGLVELEGLLGWTG